MKKWIFVFVFLVCFSSVIAMDAPIRVKTFPGFTAKVYAWTDGGGPLITKSQGMANAEGIFETTLFSLHETTTRFQVIIVDGGQNKIKDEKYDGQSTSSPLLFDCTLPMGCSVSVFTPEEEVEEEAEAKAEPEENKTNKSDSAEKVEEAKESEAPETVALTGKTIFVKSDGSINWLVIGFILFFVVIIVAFISIKLSRKLGANKKVVSVDNSAGVVQNKKVGVVSDTKPAVSKPVEDEEEDPEELELLEMRKKIKDKEKQIRKLRNKKVMEHEIEEAKRKLEAEEAELESLKVAEEKKSNEQESQQQQPVQSGQSQQDEKGQPGQLGQ